MGRTVDVLEDGERISGQRQRVRDFMLSRTRYCSLKSIAKAVGDPPASVSARLRDLRKPEFGGYVVHTRRRSRGVWESRVYTPGDPDIPPDAIKDILVRRSNTDHDFLRAVSELRALLIRTREVLRKGRSGAAEQLPKASAMLTRAIASLPGKTAL